VISFLFRFNVCTYCNNIILVFVSSKLIQIHRSGFLVIKAALVRKQHARTPTSPTHCRCDVSIFSRLIFEWVIHKTKTETCFWPRVDLMSHAAAYIMCCVSVKLHLTNRRTQDKSVVFVHRWSFQGTLGNVILIYQNVSIKVGIWWRNCNLWPVYDNFQQLCGAKVEWGGTDPVRISGNIFWSCPSTFLALKVGLQLVVLVSAFVMASTVRSVSCLLFFSSRCPPHAQPFVKVGARAPVPHGVGATGSDWWSQWCRNDKQNAGDTILLVHSHADTSRYRIDKSVVGRRHQSIRHVRLFVGWSLTLN